ncbi:CPXCG motif-containing cysteine-rich protein [Mangrovimicrobium sediminis]|uniref:CPXCG motif-containing cysteine-rich protein n=1 Tax=Mangrovimicrobium sediminis TaxID=2562682 RepID=A0A4Z0LUJ5_9GAMM|nr:CPXCG motif-containing cysteine-rich protein [Haliea sp. SAOS-164]TGD71083.1 CPXCG motif-containing cysteine-rich protein [Haliea sp. SAOS-164]
MDQLSEIAVYCPYCAERIEVLVDVEEIGQEYIEDCQVCCRPITFRIATDERGDVAVTVHDENET